MSNVLADDKHHQIVALERLGWSLRRIERTTGVRRETISGYLKAAGIVVPSRGRRRASRAKPAISTASVSTDSGGVNLAVSEAVAPDVGEAKAATRAEVSTDSVPLRRPGRAPSASACEPYRELIAEALGRGRNAMAIWQDLVDDHGFTARYASVRRFVVTLRGTSSPEARVVITTAPGEEAQVDYGDGPMVRHPDTGKYRRTRLFVLTLGYSRKAVRLLVWQSSTQIWAELHERAFRRLGGTVHVIVLDNLKEGVLTPDIYDPALNPLYRDVLAHYGVLCPLANQWDNPPSQTFDFRVVWPHIVSPTTDWDKHSFVPYGTRTSLTVEDNGRRIRQVELPTLRRLRVPGCRGGAATNFGLDWLWCLRSLKTIATALASRFCRRRLWVCSPDRFCFCLSSDWRVYASDQRTSRVRAAVCG
jgi:transposase